MDAFAKKLVDLRAKKSLIPMEQEALDTEDGEVLVRLVKPVKSKNASKKG